MSKQFLTRIVTASTAASLLAFSATLPAKADGVITLEGDTPATCSFTGATSDQTLTYTTNPSKLSIGGAGQLTVNTTVDGVFQLTGSASALSVGGSTLTSNADYSGVKYKFGATEKTALDANGDVTTDILPGGDTNVSLIGDIVPSGVNSFFAGPGATITNDNIAVSFTYTFTCAPAPAP